MIATPEGFIVKPGVVQKAKCPRQRLMLAILLRDDARVRAALAEGAETMEVLQWMIEARKGYVNFLLNYVPIERLPHIKIKARFLRDWDLYPEALMALENWIFAKDQLPVSLLETTDVAMAG